MSGHKLFVLCFGGLALLVSFYILQGSIVSNGISQYLLVIQSLQRGLHASLSDALRSVQTAGIKASLILIMLSFTYGVLHAAGPGHGKIVIAAYLTSHKSQFRQGVILSFATAIVQGISAIIIVFSTFWLLDLSMRQVRGIVNNVEVVSFAMIALVGLGITWTHVLRLRNVLIASKNLTKKPGHVSTGCCHQHGPSAKDLNTELSVRTFLGIVLSIGIRPCSGALLVLLLAISLGISTAGLLAVLAMSLGTATTITVLALFSVYLRQAAQRLLGLCLKKNNTSVFFVNILGTIGGGLILFFGLSFLSVALMAQAHPFR
jgi:nickel/cobalt transporter (NicO) family protein